MDTQWNEQWKTDGDCNQCRRYRYCSTPCKPFKIKRQEAMLAALKKILDNNSVDSEEVNNEDTD